MAFKFLWELIELSLPVACLYVALGAYAQHMQPLWSRRLERRRLAVLWTLVLAVLATKVTEDVAGGESGTIDRTVLTFIHDHVPHALAGLFEAITWSGSAEVLVPLTSAVAVALLATRRRFEALLLVASTVSGTFVVYVVKAALGRSRPDLWPARWYWGSSCPSGHTLVLASFATACALVSARIWPSSRDGAVGAALLWVALVAASRLVLGVHWPTDVLAAACIGATLPLALSLWLDFSQDR